MAAINAASHSLHKADSDYIAKLDKKEELGTGAGAYLAYGNVNMFEQPLPGVEAAVNADYDKHKLF